MFLRTAKNLILDDIQEIETQLNLTLPKQLVKHYLEFNGGIPTKSFFCFGKTDVEVSISTFLSMKYSDGINSTLEENYLNFSKRGIILKQFLPFARDWGGNQCCINLENGEVVVIWLDLGEVNEDAIRFLANDFDEFLNNLEDEEDC